MNPPDGTPRAVIDELISQVMEKESFENGEVAKILNKNFICIKVDR